MTLRGLVLATVLLLTASAFAQVPKFRFIPGPKPGGGDVRIAVDEGGTIESQKDEYSILQGGVTIEYQDIKVRAEKITYNHKTRDVVAEGNVVIDQGPTRVSATQAIYNLESKTGTFFNSTATMDPSMYFSGDRIEKVDEDTYRLTNGVFTSCDLEDPAWSLHVGEAEFTMDDYAKMKNIAFRASGVPIFWAPRLIWPTKRERSRGFLIPRVRFHEQFGTRVETGYFIPVGDSADATLYADVSTEEYFGGGIDIRYVPSENVKIGDLKAHAVNNPEAGTMEWKYEYQHAQENLPGGFRGVIDIQDYSNLDFFREYDDDPRMLTLSNIYSSAYLSRNRPKYSLNILADRRDYELLVRNPDNTVVSTRQRFEQLPSLQLRMYPQRVGKTPFYFSMESSSSRLVTGGIDRDGVRRSDPAYVRTDIFPTVSMRLNTPQWLSVKPQVSLRQTSYSASRPLECEGDNPPEACAACEENPFLAICNSRKVSNEDPVSRFYAQGQLEVVGPLVSRVYNRAAGGFSRFKHVIEPRVRYLYTSEVDNQDEIIRFDTVDTPFLPIVQDSVEYSLTQRVIGKESGENGNAREVLSMSLRQSVALSDPFPRVGSSSSRGTHQFTPLVANLRFNPYQSMTVDATAAYGNVSHQLDRVSLSANLIGTGARADKYLGFTWFSTFQQPGSSSEGASQLRLNAGSSIIPDRLRADVQLNYDAQSGRFLEHRYVAGYTGSCWGIATTYRRYTVFGIGQDQDFGSIDFAVTLKNVGTIGSR